MTGNPFEFEGSPEEKIMNPDDPNLNRILTEHGLRPTYARRLVLSLLGEKNDHPNTDGILQALRDKGYPVSTATLYQNLNKLVEVGLLIRLTDTNGLMRFDANLAPHHHLICKQCANMIDVNINDKPILKHSPVDFQSGNILSDWDIHFSHVELKGICPDCQEKNKNT
jgi:Fe2+ or Zn2+ uptake regulation protein